MLRRLDGRRAIWRVVLGALALALVLVLVFHKGPTQRYLEELDRSGLSHIEDDAATRASDSVCALLAKDPAGAGLPHAVWMAVSRSGNDYLPSDEESLRIAEIAGRNMCPDLWAAHQQRLRDAVPTPGGR